MSSAAVILFIEKLLKIAPEVISIIEDFVNHDNTIHTEQIPTILSQMAELSKNAISVSSSDGTTEASHDPVQPVDVPKSNP